MRTNFFMYVQLDERFLFSYLNLQDELFLVPSYLHGAFLVPFFLRPKFLLPQ